MWSMVAQRLTQITPPAATPDQFWQCGEAAWSAVPQEHIQSLFESMPKFLTVTLQYRNPIKSSKLEATAAGSIAFVFASLQRST
ncbi:hypothetical protein TNCV_3833331 [Trichonephila clavipes]|nr:hypothetical protein TNCV_3833331 [Trichonephila clavipes]